jgi:hypothetical protein
VVVRLVVLALLAAAIAAPAAQACPRPGVYPGDDASPESLAQWMAQGAETAGLPGELPVMAALVASGLKNLDYGDADSLGFFQMRSGIWNQGPYAGYPDHPELQLQWFIDQATDVRQARVAAGSADPITDDNMWGDWIADVMRPPEQQRGAYQPRLGEARQLIGPACAPPPPAPPPAPVDASPPTPADAAPGPAADVVPPLVRLGGASRQRALRRGALVVQVVCPAESCVASATASVRVPGDARAFRLAARGRAIPAGASATLTLTMNARLKAAARHALHDHRSPSAKVVVTVADAAGNRTAALRSVRVTG